MPLFDYRCDDCGLVKEYFVHRHDAKIMCPDCNAISPEDFAPHATVFPDKIFMVKLFTGTPAVHVFPNGGIHLKNVCAGGKTFHSRNEMKRYANEHDLELGALL